VECSRCHLLNPDDAARCDCGYDFASGEMKGSYAKAAEAERRAQAASHSVYGIGGWLLLPAIGLIVSIPMALFEAANSYRAGDAGEAAIVTVAVLLVAVTTIAFFQKRRWAPRVFILLLALNAVLAAVPVLLARGAVTPGDSRDLGRATIAALIWIPYFVLSKRVKSTFTE
jgi:hypothetical protein